MDQAPPVIERVAEIKPGTTLEIRRGGEVVYSVALPAGPARIAVEYIATTRYPIFRGRK